MINNGRYRGTPRDDRRECNVPGVVRIPGLRGVRHVNPLSGQLRLFDDPPPVGRHPQSDVFDAMGNLIGKAGEKPPLIVTDVDIEEATGADAAPF